MYLFWLWHINTFSLLFIPVWKGNVTLSQNRERRNNHNPPPEILDPNLGTGVPLGLSNPDPV